MPRDRVSYLIYIVDAGAAILRFTDSMTKEDYLNTEVVQSAVERKFTIIGEALNQLLHLYPEVRGRIREDQNIVAFRHRVIHGYFAVDELLLWSAIKHDLPDLMADTKRLLGELQS